MVTREGGGLDANAVAHVLLAQVGTPFPGGNDDVHLQVVRAQAHALGTVEGHGPDIGRGQTVVANDGKLRLVEGVGVPGHRHVQDARRVEQPPGMVGEPEDGRAAFALVGAHALEHPHAVVQGVGQHMGRGLAPGDQFPVIPDDAVSIGHGHDQQSFKCLFFAEGAYLAAPSSAPQIACTRSRSARNSLSGTRAGCSCSVS